MEIEEAVESGALGVDRQTLEIHMEADWRFLKIGAFDKRGVTRQ